MTGPLLTGGRRRYFPTLRRVTLLIFIAAAVILVAVPLFLAVENHNEADCKELGLDLGIETRYTQNQCWGHQSNGEWKVMK